ncbi:hypothetical protein TNCV_3729201 [Trichonephila clavipes]|nr:hypothetical protein TNCV_3729201 [Trichonephila clavipes]
MDLKNQWPDHHELERRRRIPFDFQRTSLDGLALNSATSRGLGRAPALQCRTPSMHHLELQDRRDYTPADRAARTCCAVCYPTADSMIPARPKNMMHDDALHIHDSGNSASGRCVVADSACSRCPLARCL